MTVEIHCIGCGEPQSHREACAVVTRATPVTPTQLVAWYHVLELVGAGDWALLVEPVDATQPELGTHVVLQSQRDEWNASATGKVEQLGCELVVRLRAKQLESETEASR